MAWFSDCEAAFTSSNEATYKRFSSTFAMLRTGPPTMYLHMILRSRLAAGHSGQNRTARRSEMRLSKIARYSASFEFFVVFAVSTAGSCLGGREVAQRGGLAAVRERGPWGHQSDENAELGKEWVSTCIKRHVRRTAAVGDA